MRSLVAAILATVGFPTIKTEAREKVKEKKSENPSKWQKAIAKRERREQKRRKENAA